MKPKKHAQQAAAGSIRITAGQYRNRKLTVLHHEGLRPTGERIRETVFNWLRADLIDAVCIDCCSGSGALALEAASRGANTVYALDTHAAAIQHIQQQCKILNCTAVTAEKVSVLDWLKRYHGQIDIAFVDPPFQAGLHEAILKQLSEHSGCHADTLLYVEAQQHQPLNIPVGWQWYRHKTTGDVQYGLLHLA